MEERREKRRSRRLVRLGTHRKYVAIILAVLVVVLAAASLIARDRKFSADENRSLAQRPALTLAGLGNGSFFSDYSSYLADQFFGRDAWIRLDAFGVRLLGRHDLNGVFAGKSGYLFSSAEEPDDMLLDRKATALNAFARAHEDLNIMVMIVPDAASVITGRLPANAPVRNQRTDITGALARLDSSVRVLDVTTTLLEHSEEEIYYHTDHHWTSLGAYYAFLASADALGPGMAVPAFDILTVTDDFQGTLASQAGIHSTGDSVQVYLPQGADVQYYVNYVDTQTRTTSMFVSSALEEKDKYTVFFGGNHPLVEIWTTANTERSLLVLKDSYANSFIQFLTTFFDRIILVDPRYYYDELSTVLSANAVTDVLFLYSGDTWMTDTTLADVLATG